MRKTFEKRKYLQLHSARKMEGEKKAFKQFRSIRTVYAIENI